MKTEDIVFDSIDLTSPARADELEILQCYCCDFFCSDRTAFIVHVNMHLNERAEEEPPDPDLEYPMEPDHDDIEFVEPDCVVCGKNEPPTDHASFDHDHPFRSYHRSCAPTRLDRVRLGLEEDPYDDREK